ncbi:hypothetical protein [Burkholderia sp. SIMBA_062]|uniref:hypothetical protein n=1 Tax=Burkholderia sp. SIMBA_062 TaxID=3085803 RepID=UPI00397D505B
MNRIWSTVGTILAILMWLAPITLVATWLPCRQVAKIVGIDVVALIVACRLPEPLVHPGFLIVPFFGVMFTYEVQTTRLNDWLFHCAFAWGVSTAGCEFLRSKLGQVRELDVFKKQSD